MNIIVIYKPDIYHQTYKWVSTIQDCNTIYAMCVNYQDRVFSFDIDDIEVIDENYMGEWH